MVDPGGVLVAASFVLLFAFSSYVLTWRLCARTGVLTRCGGVFVIAAASCTAIFYLLAPLLRFTRWYALPAAAAVAVAAWPFPEKASWLRTRAQRDTRLLRFLLRRLYRSRYGLVVVGFAAAVALPVARTAVLPPLGWDAMTYHAVKAAMWVQHGGGPVMVGPGPWAYYRHLSAGAEVLQAWSMLPTSDDTFTALLDVVEWLAVGVGVLALARRAGARGHLPASAAMFVLAIPTVRRMLGSAYSEPFLLSTFLIGLALLLASGAARAPLILGALALGLAGSAKASMLPVTCTVVLVAVLRESVRRPDRRMTAGAMVLAYAAATAPWAIATAAATGRPFSPFDLHVGSFSLGRMPPEVAWYIDRGAPAFEVRRELSVLAQLFAPPSHAIDAIGAFAAIPLVAMLAGFVPVARRKPYTAVLMAAAMIACVGFFYSQGFAAIRHTFPQNSGRFLLPAIACATVVWIAACPAQSAAGSITSAVLVICAGWNLAANELAGFSPVSVRASLWVMAAGAVVTGMWVGASRWRAPSIRLGIPLAATAAAVIALLPLRDSVRDSVLRSDYALHGFAKWWFLSEAVPYVDHPGEPLRIAVTSGPAQNLDTWFVYPFMGRRLQNEMLYVPVAGDGRVHAIGDERAYARLAAASDFSTWQLRLRRQHVTHVISFDPPSIELGWMEAHAESFERLAGNISEWGVFRVRDDR